MELYNKYKYTYLDKYFRGWNFLTNLTSPGLFNNFISLAQVYNGVILVPYNLIVVVWPMGTADSIAAEMLYFIFHGHILPFF